MKLCVKYIYPSSFEEISSYFDYRVSLQKNNNLFLNFKTIYKDLYQRPRYLSTHNILKIRVYQH